MKKTILFFSCFIYSVLLIAQSQYAVSTATYYKNPNDAKIDPNDGGVIMVGGYSYPFMMKLNSSKALVWSKIITPGGFINKVIICANGDYVAIGTYPIDGRQRALACRVNPSNGAIIWSTASSNASYSNSSSGDWFASVVETQNGDIAIAGSTDWYDYVNGVNGIVVVLNGSTGNEIWGKIYHGSSGVTLSGIDQLPNGDLVVAGSSYNASTFRHMALMIEFSESTGAVHAQNTYSIPSYGVANPGPFPLFLTSLHAVSCKSFSNGVVVQYDLSPGNTGYVLPAVYVYDLTTRALSGNWFYHTDHDFDVNVIVYPLSTDNYIIAEADYDHVMVYRWNNGFVYDREFNNSPRKINVFTSIDIHNSDMVLGGSMATNPGFLCYSTTAFPTSSGSCGVINNDNGGAYAHALDPETDGTTLSDADVMESVTLETDDDSPYLTDLCACPDDVTTNVNKCYTSNITLDAGSGSTYSWTPSTNLSATNVQSPTCTATSSTTYTVTITSGSCTFHKIFNVTVVGRADQTQSGVKCSAQSSINNPLTLSATGGTAWAWTPSSGLSATNVQNPVASGSTTTSYSVTVTNSGATGCTNHDIYNLQVKYVPVVGGTFSGGTSTTTICNGSSITLPLTVAGSGYASYTYSWTSTPSGFSNSTQNPVVSPTVNTRYTVVVTGYPGTSPLPCNSLKNFDVHVNSCRQGIALNEPEAAIHNNIMLNQNAPNPFGEKTEISYYIPEGFQHAVIKFTNITGELVRTEEIKQPGSGKITVYGKDIHNGVYTYSLIVDGKMLVTKKMIRL